MDSSGEHNTSDFQQRFLRETDEIVVEFEKKLAATKQEMQKSLATAKQALLNDHNSRILQLKKHGDIEKERISRKIEAEQSRRLEHPPLIETQWEQRLNELTTQLSAYEAKTNKLKENLKRTRGQAPSLSYDSELESLKELSLKQKTYLNLKNKLEQKALKPLQDPEPLAPLQAEFQGLTKLYRSKKQELSQILLELSEYDRGSELTTPRQPLFSTAPVSPQFTLGSSVSSSRLLSPSKVFSAYFQQCSLFPSQHKHIQGLADYHSGWLSRVKYELSNSNYFH